MKKRDSVEIRKSGSAAQLKSRAAGLPARLQTGIENLSGMAMDDVQVHYNSSKPAQFMAHAYAQGNQIHLSTGQEKHLPHEAWHIVQQKQGRVRPTMQLMQGVNINDDNELEKEADVMGAKALQFSMPDSDTGADQPESIKGIDNKVVQRVAHIYTDHKTNRSDTIRKITVPDRPAWISAAKKGQIKEG